MSAHARLRAETRFAHDRVDALFGGHDLADPQDYTRFLAAQAAAFLPVEAALDAAGAGRLFPHWTAHRRGMLLRADLADLRAPLPEPVEPPRFDDDPAIAGGVYVLEGSRLGGTMLRRSVPAHLPRRFLDAPQEPGAWRRVLQRLDGILDDADRIDRAVVAASRTFDCFAAAGRLSGGL